MGLIQDLLDRGAKVDLSQDLVLLEAHRDTELMNKFVGADGWREMLKAEDVAGKTMLHHAASTGDEDTIYEMIKAGGNLVGSIRRYVRSGFNPRMESRRERSLRILSLRATALGQRSPELSGTHKEKSPNFNQKGQFRSLFFETKLALIEAT